MAEKDDKKKLSLVAKKKMNEEIEHELDEEVSPRQRRRQETAAARIQRELEEKRMLLGLATSTNPVAEEKPKGLPVPNRSFVQRAATLDEDFDRQPTVHSNKSKVQEEEWIEEDVEDLLNDNYVDSDEHVNYSDQIEESAMLDDEMAQFERNFADEDDDEEVEEQEEVEVKAPARKRPPAGKRPPAKKSTPAKRPAAQKESADAKKTSARRSRKTEEVDEVGSEETPKRTSRKSQSSSKGRPPAKKTSSSTKKAPAKNVSKSASNSKAPAKKRPTKQAPKKSAEAIKAKKKKAAAKSRLINKIVLFVLFPVLLLGGFITAGMLGILPVDLPFFPGPSDSFTGQLMNQGFTNTVWTNIDNPQLSFLFREDGRATRLHMDGPGNPQFEHANNFDFQWSRRGDNITFSIIDEFYLPHMNFPVNQSLALQFNANDTAMIIGGQMFIRSRPTMFGANQLLNGVWMADSGFDSIFFDVFDDGNGDGVLTGSLASEGINITEGDFMWWTVGGELFVLADDWQIHRFDWNVKHDTLSLIPFGSESEAAIELTRVAWDIASMDDIFTFGHTPMEPELIEPDFDLTSMIQVEEDEEIETGWIPDFNDVINGNSDLEDGGHDDSADDELQGDLFSNFNFDDDLEVDDE